jgi:glycosyltransferase involved in cell wall biosynthesis
MEKTPQSQQGRLFMSKKFAIHITTKNRLDDLVFTLQQIKSLLDRVDTQCVIFDDGSTDGTSNYLKENFPQVMLHRNEISKGYIFCRNKMLNETKAEYAVSLDDDAHFLSENPLQNIESHFKQNPDCGLIAFRIFWGKAAPENMATNETAERVKSFVGCGHAWRMTAWRSIPNYPEWFGFYGEELFASLQLFRRKLEVHFVPKVLIQHRVDMQARKSNAADFKTRFRNSLRADWYNYFLFYPFLPRYKKWLYSVKMQFTTKIFNGKTELFFPLMGAFWDVVSNTQNIRGWKFVMTREEYQNFMKLPEAKIFWKP